MPTVRNRHNGNLRRLIFVVAHSHDNCARSSLSALYMPGGCFIAPQISVRNNETGAIRDGQPVTKSKLKPSSDAYWVATYLRRRAAGEPRAYVRRDMEIEVSVSTLIGMEWNALTCAGHTVWNVHAKRDGGGYVGGHKRHPRGDWHICRDTHEALISEEEAEAKGAARLHSNRSRAPF